MAEIKKTWINHSLQRYQKDNNNGFASCVIHVRAENGGHGCLFGLDLPEHISIDGFCWSGDNKHPSLDDFLDILDAIKKDYHIRR